MTGHSIAHNDEPEGDGPGAFISNLCLQGEGMLYFFDKRPRIVDKKQLPMTGVWQIPGDLISFSGDCRIFMSHGVLMMLPPKVQKLPLTGSALKTNKTWSAGVRIVATLRCGRLDKKEQTVWNHQWVTVKTKEEKAMEDAEDTEDTESEDDSHFDLTVHPKSPNDLTVARKAYHGGMRVGMREEKASTKKPSARPAKIPTGGITPRRHPPAEPENNQLVPLGYAWMPGKGDVLTPRSSPWNDTIFVAVKSNFVEFSRMERRTGGKYSNYLSLRPGCSFQMKFCSKQATRK